MKRAVAITGYSGGKAPSRKEGIRDSHGDVKRLDIHTDVSKFSILPKTVATTGATITGLIIDAVQVPDGSIYAVDEDKKIYKVNTSNVVSVIGTITGDTNGTGIFYVKQKDTVYITTNTSVSTYGPLGGTPTLRENFYDTYTAQALAVFGVSYPQTSSLQALWSLDEEATS